jgi:hypothetical protein
MMRKFDMETIENLSLVVELTSVCLDLMKTTLWSRLPETHP